MRFTMNFIIFVFVIMIPVIILSAYLTVLVVRALNKYLKSHGPSAEAMEEKSAMKQSLGEAIREHRVRCNMTQEFVAESLGVSRQAVSKWENGTSDPSTSNLLALAKLFGISAEELLRSVE